MNPGIKEEEKKDEEVQSETEATKEEVKGTTQEMEATKDQENGRRGNIDAEDKCGNSALQWACREKKYEVIEKLIKRGADIQKVSENHAYEDKVVRTLCENGWKRPYLSARARHNGYAEIKRVMSDEEVRKKVEILCGRDERGLTAADYACTSGSYSLACELMTLGARVIKRYMKKTRKRRKERRKERKQGRNNIAK